MKDLISILMPVKNGESFLKECLDSIVLQNLKNWELIVVDDHSSDQSSEILSQYAISDNRIKVFQNKGNGIIPALRMALKNSKGQFVTRMDADDIMPPNKLEILLDVLRKSGKNHVATGLVNYFSKTEVGDGYRKYEQWLNELTINSNNYTEIYKECVIPSPCWMMYREDLVKCGSFDSEVYPEDYDLCFRMYENQMKVVSANQILHLWRDHQNRVSRNGDNYKDNRFLKLKVHYFLKLDYNPENQLVLWGVGKKGKELAKELNHENIPFVWISNNSKKIGHLIHDQLIVHTDSLKGGRNYQIIVAIAERNFNPIEELKNIDFIESDSRIIQIC